MQFLSLRCYFLYLNIIWTLTLKVSQSVYCFTTSISHGVENYFPRLWGTGISNAILCLSIYVQSKVSHFMKCNVFFLCVFVCLFVMKIGNFFF